MQHLNATDQTQSLLQDLLAPFPNEEDDDLLLASSSFMQLISPSIQLPTFEFSEPIFPTLPNLDSFNEIYESMVSVQDTYLPTVDFDDKIHEEQQIPEVFRGEKKNKSKKVAGQPSKNLMAERRRRKRLNDRLSMLRSIVPKISKMDRTSILADTIEYMKELLEKIQNLSSDSNSWNFMGNSQSRNDPKIEIERRIMDTRIQICCSEKPGLVLSMLNTLEALGLDIQQCVISSFSDFSIQASCSEEPEYQSMTSSEEIKQILFRNAGYGGRYSV